MRITETTEATLNSRTSQMLSIHRQYANAVKDASIIKHNLKKYGKLDILKGKTRGCILMSPVASQQIQTRPEVEETP